MGRCWNHLAAEYLTEQPDAAARFSSAVSRAGEMNEESLIDLVRERDFLYNPYCKLYKDQRARNAAWQEISQMLEGVSAQECKDAWTKLRNAYTNALKRRQSISGQTARKFPKWKYEDQMSFVKVTQEPRQMRSYVKEEESLEEGGKTSENGDFADGEEAQGTDWDAPDSAAESLPSSNRRQDPTERKASRNVDTGTLQGSLPNIVDVMKQNCHARSSFLAVSTQKQEQDEIDMFFMGLACTVKRLSPQEQIRVKMEVASSVFQAELRQLSYVQAASSTKITYSNQTDEYSRSSRNTATPSPHSSEDSEGNTMHCTNYNP